MRFPRPRTQRLQENTKARYLGVFLPEGSCLRSKGWKIQREDNESQKLANIQHGQRRTGARVPSCAAIPFFPSSTFHFQCDRHQTAIYCTVLVPVHSIAAALFHG
eukprot:scaffold1467_cov264-Pinguiococcus_pyrenoidosus.AAC.3